MQIFTGAIVEKLNDKEIVNLARCCAYHSKSLSDEMEIFTAKIEFLHQASLIYLDLKNGAEDKTAFFSKIFYTKKIQ